MTENETLADRFRALAEHWRKMEAKPNAGQYERGYADGVASAYEDAFDLLTGKERAPDGARCETCGDYMGRHAVLVGHASWMDGDAWHFDGSTPEPQTSADDTATLIVCPDARPDTWDEAADNARTS